MKVTVVMDRQELLRNAVAFLSDSTVSNGEHSAGIRLTVFSEPAIPTGTASAVPRSQGPYRTRDRGSHETGLPLGIFSSSADSVPATPHVFIVPI